LTALMRGKVGGDDDDMSNFKRQNAGEWWILMAQTRLLVFVPAGQRGWSRADTHVCLLRGGCSFRLLISGVVGYDASGTTLARLFTYEYPPIITTMVRHVSSLSLKRWL
jgi:hypothetical protein